LCRNIRPLFNYEPPAGDGDIRAAASQYVRKVSGFAKPSSVNNAAYDKAVEEIAGATRILLRSLKTSAPPRDRGREIAKARAQAVERFRR
jgi:hypothetical protein